MGNPVGIEAVHVGLDERSVVCKWRSGWNTVSREWTNVELMCAGVEFTDTSLQVISGNKLVEGDSAHQITFDILVDSDAAGGSVSGTNLWQVRAYATGSGTTGGSVINPVSVTLTPSQSGTGINAGTRANIMSVTANLNLENTLCTGLAGICVILQQNPSSNPTFTFDPQPNSKILTSCVPATCTGVQVTDVNFILISGAPLQAGSDSNDIALDLNIITDGGGAGVSGSNLWQVELFLNSQIDGQGVTSLSRLTSIPALENSQSLTAGISYTLEDVATTLNLRNMDCANLPFVCVRLSKHPGSNPAFTLSEPYLAIIDFNFHAQRKAAKMIRRTRNAPKPSQNQAAAPEETAGADESVEEPSANPPQPPLTLADLNNSITEFQSFISSKLDGISTDVAAINKRFTDLEVSVNFNAEKIREIEDRKLPEVKDSTQKMMKVLENKIISLEIHNRKSNLLFYGINQNEGEDVYKVLKDAFATLGVDDAPTIAIANAHRLPRRGAADQTSQRGPVPIIARFCYMENRNAILAVFDNQQRNRAKASASPARAQPQSRLTVRTDLPPSLRIRRALLATEAYKMRKEQGLSTKIFVRGTEVCLQSKEKGTSKWIDYKD
eukprot:XP_011677605.1 PREDICTED: uncharacterized protein LOC105444702 [Strongylocentrotus purpuratus]